MWVEPTVLAYLAGVAGLMVLALLRLLVGRAGGAPWVGAAAEPPPFFWRVRLVGESVGGLPGLVTYHW